MSTHSRSAVPTGFAVTCDHCGVTAAYKHGTELSEKGWVRGAIVKWGQPYRGNGDFCSLDHLLLEMNFVAERTS